MASASLTAGLLLWMAASTNAQIGYWQCEVTHYFRLPEIWTCTLSENCCLTGSRLMATGCCKEMKDESVFTQTSGYKTCSPISSKKYYCPSNRDCCTVARSGGKNETGCCVSQTVTDMPLTGSQPTLGYGVDEVKEDTPSQHGYSDSERNSHSKLHRRLSTGTILMIALIPCLAVVIFIVTAVYYLQAKKSRQQRRMRGVRRAQLQAAALGFHPTENDSGVAYEASGVAPPSYWETVDQREAVPVPAVSLAPQSQGEHRRPPTGNIQYSRLENEE